MKIHQITPTCTVFEGDVLEALRGMPDDTYHCIVTSPPYWGLRSYLKPSDPLKALELGSEPTPAEYIANQVAVFHEVKRVLHPTGQLWVNIGDTYAGGRMGGYSDKQSSNRGIVDQHILAHPPDVEQGEPVGIPDMLKNALRADGWRHRDTVIWSKPAPMPASLAGWRWTKCRVKVGTTGKSKIQLSNMAAADVMGCGAVQHPEEPAWSDCPGCPKCLPHGGYVLRKGQWRTTTAHEYLFLFVKSDKYFADAVAVKESSLGTTGGASVGIHSEHAQGRHGDSSTFNTGHRVSSGTRNPRSVQTWGPEPCKFAHYASFPSALPRFFIKAATSAKGCCPTCGTPWSPVVRIDGETTTEKCKRLGYSEQRGAGGEQVVQNLDYTGGHGNNQRNTCVLGYRQSCQCPPLPPEPCRVLDPFAGTGTTLTVAESMGLISDGVELNPKYVEFIRQRILYKDVGSGADIISGKRFF